MLMNWAEAAVINNAVRRGLQRFYEAPLLARLGDRALFGHPAEDRFTVGEFLAECTRHGLDPGERWVTRVGGDYLVGVAHRGGPEAL